MRVTLDFETASACDLQEAGAWAYWEHPTTEILCLCWHDEVWGDGCWLPGDNDALDALADLAGDPTVIFEAHNAPFEQAGWEIVMVRQLGMPRIPIERWDCTMARSYYRGLPGALDKAVEILGLEQQKDKEGRALTLSLSKPMSVVHWATRKPEGITHSAWRKQFVKGTYDRSPATLRRAVQYCAQDVRSEIGLGEAVGPLSAYERRVWELDQRMNQRGIRVDLDYVRASKAVVEEASKALIVEFSELTGGLEPTQVKALTEWCNNQGLKIDSLSKDNLKRFGITGIDNDEEDGMVPVAVRAGTMPQGVRRALEIRAVLGSASVAKLYRILACVCYDGRIRYAIQYHGAGTGRWAGRLFQPQNFPRGKIEGGHDPQTLVDLIMLAKKDPREAVSMIQMVYGDPIAAVASGLRHALIPADGHVFHCGDFAGIEMRDVLALAGQYDRCKAIAAGESPYLDFGQMMFGHPIDKNNLAEYVPAKSGVLGGGFGCGADNFNEKFLGGKDLLLAEKVIKTYRYSWAPEVPKLWSKLEEAALTAVREQRVTEVHGIRYEWTEGWLACRLPDGQTMWYRSPQYGMRPMPWDKDDIRPGWSYHAMKMGHWRKIEAYGGLLTENVVQKRARGYLCEAMLRLEEAGFPLVMTVHDECLAEVPEDRANQKLFEEIMVEPSNSARAYKVPIAVEGWEGERYRK